MSIIEKADFSGRDLRSYNFGSHIYKRCLFIGADGRESQMQNAYFSECDFSGFDSRKAVVRMTCTLGSKNKLDAHTAAAFLYWFRETYQLPASIEVAINAIIYPFRRSLYEYFNRENT